MHTQSDEHYVAGGVLEAKRTGCTATAHGEHQLAVIVGPGATVGVVPDGLLNQPEEVGTSLVDTKVNGVRHSSGTDQLMDNTEAETKDKPG